MRKYLWVFGLFAFITFVTPSVVYAQDVSETKLKEKFFTELTDNQRIKLLEVLDRGKQLTSYELGAKYRWGQIPQDRRPPFALAQWWKSLTEREKDQERLDWFKENYLELPLDRAARELNEDERLTNLYQELEKNREIESDKFEDVPFPQTADTSDQRFDDSVRDQKVFRQSNNTKTDGSTSDLPAFLTESSRKTNGSKSSDQSQKTENGSTPETSDSERMAEETVPSRSEKTGKARELSDAMSEDSDTDNVQVTSQTFGDTRVIFRREGGRVQVLRRSAHDTESNDTVDRTSNTEYLSIENREKPDRETNDFVNRNPFLERKRTGRADRLNFPSPNVRHIRNYRYNTTQTDLPRLRALP